MTYLRTRWCRFVCWLIGHDWEPLWPTSIESVCKCCGNRATVEPEKEEK
jgi:hypothetical protein